MLLSESLSKVSPSVTAAPPPVPRPADTLPPAAPPRGQLLFGTDKRNPVFAVYADEADEHLIVFYGFEVIKVVRNDPHAPAYKLNLQGTFSMLRLANLPQEWPGLRRRGFSRNGQSG